MNPLELKIDSLSDATLEVFACLANLNISFENEALYVDLKIKKNSTDPRIGKLDDRVQLKANNGERVKVVNADGTPSMIQALDTQSNPIQRVVTPPEPIYKEMVDENGDPILDEEGNPFVDADGNPIKELTGYTEPVMEDVYVQETIGEFDFWKLKYQPLIADLIGAIARNFDNGSEEVVYVKE